MLRIAALVISALLALGAPVHADINGISAPADEILSTLRGHGYRILEDERTWLGRQRIVAEKNGSRREVVFNPGTGEVLRDYSFRIEAGKSPGESSGATAAADDTGVAASVSSDPGLSVGDTVGNTAVRDSNGSNSQANP